mgnify:CR=1 FL=1
MPSEDAVIDDSLITMISMSEALILDIKETRENQERKIAHL